MGVVEKLYNVIFERDEYGESKRRDFIRFIKNLSGCAEETKMVREKPC